MSNAAACMASTRTCFRVGPNPAQQHTATPALGYPLNVIHLSIKNLNASMVQGLVTASGFSCNGTHMIHLDTVGVALGLLWCWWIGNSFCSQQDLGVWIARGRV